MFCVITFIIFVFMKQPTNYTDWETATAEIISTTLDIPYSDACAIMEAVPFTISQSWELGSSPEETANKIINQ